MMSHLMAHYYTMFQSVYSFVCFMTFLHISTSKIIQSCYNTFELVSEYKTTRQSTTHATAAASYAVDGGTNGQYSKRTCTHTTLMNNPWWYVDLGTEKVISKIVIFNREDCCAERLAGAEVRVGNNKAPPFSGNAQCAWTISRMDAIAINPIEMSCNPPISGRYVTVYKQLRGYLTLCEVQVYTDIEKPEVVCPDDIELYVGNNHRLHQVDWNPPEVSDNFHTDLSATCSPSSGSLFPVEFTKVTCSATDATGNEGNCSFVVNIADDREPDLVCPEHITVGNNTDQYEDPVTWSDPTVTDNLHKNMSATCTHASGSIFDVGSTIVTCSATDGTGNVGSCSFVVHVIGQTFISNDVRPVLTCPGHITVNGDQSRDPITWSNPTLTSKGTLSTCTPPSGYVFDDGSTIVTCSARDSNGDVIRCSFVVHVEERVNSDLAIGIVCPSDITFNTDQRVVVWNDPELTDNVGTDVQPTCIPPSGSTFEVGSTRVTCYAVYPIVNISCWFNVGSTERSTPFANHAQSARGSMNTHSLLVAGLTVIITLGLIALLIGLIVRYRKKKKNQFGINMKADEGTVKWEIMK